ncbi:ring-cleaving dioxygenase [Salinigranum rubrum]|uniref:Ring-cleaving dioxygenase n=1 Tax=Salinigranum rubrum TaxID=755307 RepID=A0A2I8VIU0_9EURY|nr:ring-cleaving dioxygenase [Salinigranum rubrum]AUV80969.1 ring-cleaving dioxygenase [Salinigranum rubrum]
MNLPPSTPGMHHVSVITGTTAETHGFYSEVLGLRFVKRTVNYDDQFMHHLYFGDERGRPGTLLTCFPFERGQEGRVGRPQPTATALSVPRTSIEYWTERLAGVERTERFGEPVLRFTDGAGQPLELVGSGGKREPWTGGPVPSEHAIGGLHSVTLASASPFQTASVLDALGFTLESQAGDRVRYRVEGGETGAVVDVLDSNLPFGREGIGTVHHVAFRVADREALEAWRDVFIEDGLSPSRVRDRRYFHSLYVREPGGILFELATEGPGLTVDESVDALGESLQLPPWLEADREMIAPQLPPIPDEER